jgi:hypothetical protein
MPGESAEGLLVSSPIDNEDDDKEKLLFVESFLTIRGSFLPSEAKTEELLMEGCLDELELEDLEEWACVASCCLEEAALCLDLKEEEECLL